MNAQGLYDQYVTFERKYGVEAVEAMLRWLWRAEHSHDDRCQALAAAIGDVLIARCLNVFGALDETEKVQAYRTAADKVLHLVRLALVIETSAEVEV